MALLERSNTRDIVGIYFCKDWKLMIRIELDTDDATDIYWLKGNTHIMAWDGRSKVLIKSVKFQFFLYAKA